MKIKKFVYTKIGGGKDYSFAEITVESGVLFWKKTETKTIFKPKFSSYWRYLDNGKFTEGFDVEDIEASALARRRLTDA